MSRHLLAMLHVTHMRRRSTVLACKAGERDCMAWHGMALLPTLKPTCFGATAGGSLRPRSSECVMTIAPISRVVTPQEVAHTRSRSEQHPRGDETRSAKTRCQQTRQDDSSQGTWRL